MKINLWLTSKDCGDGSYTVSIVNTKEEALEILDRTEEQLSEGNTYEDGYLEEITLELDENGKLTKPFCINIE
jgi:hypothetical protein